MKIKFKYSKPIDPFIPGAWVMSNGNGTLSTWGNKAWRVHKKVGDNIELLAFNQRSTHKDWNINTLKVIEEGLQGVIYKQ